MTNKMTYNELKQALKTARTETCKEIAAVIIQSKNGISAREIARTLNYAISAPQVSGLIEKSEVRDAMGALGYNLRNRREIVSKTYVNVEDPNDTICISRRVTKYEA